ncbi:MAG TPA: hypothetical protein VNW92_04340, partial [Polyangiaceae bacterium]|nr:hypothetical protein [Polyangiaceae bacterium]
LSQTQVYSLLQIALGTGVFAWVSHTRPPRPALDLSRHWLQVTTSSAVLPPLCVATLLTLVAFGVHFRKIGAWVGAPTADRVASS